MQNAAFRAAGIDARYEALEVPLERLDGALSELHAEGVLGLALTPVEHGPGQGESRQKTD